MIRKPMKLDFVDVVLGATSDIIRKALEARLKIDDLLVAREEAYRKIADLETQVEELVGVEGAFVYPPPPYPVAGIPTPTECSRSQEVAKPAKPAKKPVKRLAADDDFETGDLSADVSIPQPTHSEIEADEE